jgi:5-hydroxyisourate hydrolase
MAARLTTHVLDTARGVPAAGVGIALFALDGDARTLLAQSVSNADGRTAEPLALALEPGMYELVFDVAAYFAAGGTPGFYDRIPVRFRIDAGATHYHVPLLVAPWGYATYRGS